MNKKINKIKRQLEKVLQSHSLVYSVGSWCGNEVKVTLESLEPEFIKFAMNDAGTKYKISVCFNGLPDINGMICTA